MQGLTFKGMRKEFPYLLVATGGTFDRFHKGHQALLTTAFETGEKVIIGITSDEMVKAENKVLKDFVLPYEVRVTDVHKFLDERGYLGREIIVKLNLVYGPTVLENGLGAIVCTRETRRGASEINKARKKKGLPKVDVIECPFISSSDGYHISSTRIRLGEIDREGDILLKYYKGRKLPQTLCMSLAKPIDIFFPNINQAIKNIGKPPIIISVGDVVFGKLLKSDIFPQIAILDLKVGRSEIENKWNIKFNFRVCNRPGTVSQQLIKVVKTAIVRSLKNRKVKSLYIYVHGEEDLAVLPAILVAPLGSLIFYGQPKNKFSENGVVRVTVTEEKKKWVTELLGKFI